MRTLISYIFAIAATWLLFCGCSSHSGKPILILLPDSLTGEFEIIKDSENGQDLVEKNGQWLFEIPPNGKLYVKDDRPFYRWHEEVARYKNGKSVTYEDLGTLLGSRSTGSNASEASTDFVGTTHRWRVIPEK